MRDIPRNKKNNSYRRWSGFIRGRSPEPFRVNKDYFIRIRGLPVDSDEVSIKERFRAIRIQEKNISLMYGMDGKFTGEAVLKLLNDRDYKEIMSYHLGAQGSSILEIYEARKEDYEAAQNSKNPESRVAAPQPIIPEGAKLVSISGLTERISEVDLKLFVGQVRLTGNGIMRGVLTGGKLGSEAIVMVNAESDMKQL